ncbi:hypothetical protein QOZ80_1BG0058730 [Eleusine coracana subsp. coracana]|nr:hypothetical protein QOZ80_1BG0058730 [Eleusine coracana subsp. coracana]
MRKAAATPPGGTPTMKMKLLIDTVAQRVLFAEAGKDVIDFIFGILAMPMSAILKLVADDDADAFGSVPNVYASVEKMDDAHMQCKNARDVLLADPGSGSGSGSAESDDDDDGYASYSAPPPPKTGLEIVTATLNSKTVLTDVFLAKKKRARTDSKHGL